MTFPARLARSKRLTVAQQLMGLRRVCPDGRGGFYRVGALQWNYETRPTSISRVYKIQIRYRLGKSPEVFVMSPNLRDLSGGTQIPHLYDQDRQKLCLYLPGTGEWTATKLIADTIVPWTNLWLYYFEDWLETREWHGGGKHPAADPKTRKRKRVKHRKTARTV